MTSTSTFIGRLGVLLLATASVLLAGFPPAASAGTFPMYQCGAGGTTVVAPGWSVFESTTDAGISLSNTCQSNGAIGVEPTGGQVTENGNNTGGTVGLALNVPASAPGETITAISAHLLISAAQGDDAFAGFDSDGQNLPGLEDFNGGSGINTNESWTLPLGARDFEASVFCSTDGSNPTCYYPTWNEVPALNDITITLSDSTPPQVGGVTGTLATAAAGAGVTVSGAQTLGFAASDAGSGVRTAALTLSPLNGGAPYVHTFNFSGECAYDSWNACPLTQTVSGFSVNTTALANGIYAASLTITDAAGNVTNDALGSVTVNNPSAVASSLGALPGPGAGAPASSIGIGSPNGAGASETAHLQLGVRAAISRSYGRRALRVSGRLLNAQGLPIVGATLDVLQQDNGATLELVDHARTGADGTFVAAVPAGPSRMIEIGYRAFSADSSYAASTRLRESVRAGVRLTVNPRRTGSEGTITLTGRVLGPIPPQGVVVELLVHYRGRWEPFRDPRTDRRGRFHVVYQFQGGIGRFPFRAEVPGSQAGFPFDNGESRVVNVSTS